MLDVMVLVTVLVGVIGGDTIEEASMVKVPCFLVRLGQRVRLQ